jgi:hypothetical protein
MSKSIYNLTGSKQPKSRLTEFSPLVAMTVRNLLQFDDAPTEFDINTRSEYIAEMVKRKGVERCKIDSLSCMANKLTYELNTRGIEVI